jgi:site-specific DNA-methyltransferase (adenine-specific)
MNPYYADATVRLFHGDCLDVLRELPDNSVDAVVTDPPYGLEFMGKEWDAPWKAGEALWDRKRPGGQAGRIDGNGGMDTFGDRPNYKAGRPFQQWCELWAAECLRVLKPGGHMLAFGGTRTFHRLACAVEDAGFEIRDSIAWLYGSGFPKSLDVSKAIDKAAGATGTYGEPKSAAHAGWLDRGRMRGEDGEAGWQRPWMQDETALSNAARKYEPGSDAARQWQGWGTALKPAFEPIVVARKPLTGTVAGNVTAWGTGALNVDGCRIDTNGETWGGNEANAHTDYSGKVYGTFGRQYAKPSNPAGRWPANVVLDESQADALDQMSGERPGSHDQRHDSKPASMFTGCQIGDATGFGDRGGASRFFYTAKADAKERIRLPKEGAGEGRVTGLGGKIRECNICGTRAINSGANELSCGHNDHRWVDNPRAEHVAHPTVKPLSLMRWLVRLVTPPGGTVLEPFAGSGTTVEACVLEGFHCIAVEREAEYLPLIVQRVNRQRDPIAYTATAGEDLGLFGFEELA